MFRNFYYSNIKGQHVYFTIHVNDKGYELSYYKDQSLIARKNFNSKFLTFNVYDEKIEVRIKGFYPKVAIQSKDSSFNINRIKHKSLRSILRENDIVNEVSKVKVKYKLTLMDIIVPIVLIAFGLFLYHIVRNKSNYWEIPSMLVLLLAYWILYGNLFKLFTFSIFDKEIKLILLLLLTFLSMAISQDLMNFLQ